MGLGVELRAGGGQVAKSAEPDKEGSCLPGEKAPPGREEAAAGAELSGLLKTAEVLRRTGITHQILYRYITLGLIEPAETTGTGQRFFRPNVVDFIELIKSLNQSGYSLRHIKEIFFKDEKVHRLARPEQESRSSGDAREGGPPA